MSQTENEMEEVREETIADPVKSLNSKVSEVKEQLHLKKSWRDYLFEFTVPFLAVTAAFLLNAERENYIDRQLEKEYVNSMIEDLDLDTAYMNTRKKFIQITIHRLDTLIKYLQNPDSKTIHKIYNSSSGVLYAGPVFRANDRTLQQLKNTGGLRLIRNKNISDKIIRWDEAKQKWEVYRKQLPILTYRDADGIPTTRKEVPLHAIRIPCRQKSLPS